MDGILAQIYNSVDVLLRQAGLTSLGGSGQGLIIIGGAFLLALVLGLARHHMLSWSIKGAGFGLVFGAIVTLVIEGVFLVGGKTVVSEVVKNKETPEIVRVFLQKNIVELAELVVGEPRTLGAESLRDSKSVISDFRALSPLDRREVQGAICSPR